VITRNRVQVALAIMLAALLVAGAAAAVRATVLRPKTITAYFSSATAIYPGDDVRVAGVKVGTIAAIRPEGQQAVVTLAVDHAVPIPAQAKAVIVAQNLIAARYVQLTPAYETSGPTMSDGAIIPVERTAVPVEWDEVKDQLMRLATDLGPRPGANGTSVSRFIDSAATALDGNGHKLRDMLAQLSGIARILATGSGNVIDTIKNLQIFVTALRDSNTQIVQFEGHLATLTSVLNNSRTDLDAALTDLSSAVGDVQQFIADTRDKTSEQISRLASVTQNLVDHKTDLENVLHVAPNAIANQYNIYNPDSGAPVGSFVFNNMSDPLQFYCEGIGAIENATGAETSKLCALYLGPTLRVINFNYLPIPTNPVLTKSPSPGNLIYSEPNLAPGGSGPKPGPPETPPAISAYTGLNGDMAPPAGYVPPADIPRNSTAPEQPPASPPPPKLPQDMLFTPQGASP
jgi:phospholipid/cholesterol/gamma-HCH transport system substrate-binding protein